ncbi:MAG: class I SAM-dependent methyltransferase, partial [Bradyrhizobium sp.]|nr:class I SAM-dependent methyltransferase [Bradyrhizobium sp.]
MDRLLRRLLSRFICRGSISFATADGTTFRCGDGTGVPVAARFLTHDADRQYSCAYFETPDATLDDAQLAKKRH